MTAAHYTAAEAAARLGVTRAAVVESHRAGLLPAVRLHWWGRLWFRRDMIDELAEQAVAP